MFTYVSKHIIVIVLNLNLHIIIITFTVVLIKVLQIHNIIIAKTTVVKNVNGNVKIPKYKILQ